MKKIDKLIIQAFLGPFILTFLVIVFILLTVQMMNYVDEIFGKDLQWLDLGRLIFHFSVFQTPIAFPLAVMLASLMTFGNLGEHFELTAIKSAGISLVRALMPIYIMVMVVTVLAFYSNNYFVPYSALKAYSLLYDIRQKKPALDIQPGQFYAGIENYKIKVDEKFPDGKTLLGLTIYDHSSHKGNTEVIMADSGQMYTILNDQYLKFELFNGTHYVEGDAPVQRRRARRNDIVVRPFTRTSFDKSEIVFDLSSFGMTRTDEGLFASNRLMRNFSQLNIDLDSLQNDIYSSVGEIYGIANRYFTYSNIKKQARIPSQIQVVLDKQDSLRKLELKRQRLMELSDVPLQNEISVKPPPTYGISLKRPPKKVTKRPKDSFRIKDPKKPSTKSPVKTSAIKELSKSKKKEIFTLNKPDKQKARREAIRKNRDGSDGSFTEKEKQILARFNERSVIKTNYARNLKTAVATSRQIKSKLTAQNNRRERLQKEFYIFNIQWHKMLANAFACISMFLIGAPLGAIIKRGGLGFPVIISVFFFIIYYVVSIGGEKYAKGGSVSVEVGVWSANALLLPIGLIFLRQAKNDARLFEADFYKVMFAKLTVWFGSLNQSNKDQ